MTTMVAKEDWGMKSPLQRWTRGKGGDGRGNKIGQTEKGKKGKEKDWFIDQAKGEPVTQGN